jgi:LCP family protein required for cell wall assembly
MKQRNFLLLILFGCLFTGCTNTPLFFEQFIRIPPASFAAQFLPLNSDPSATATLTPFQPIPPTATATVTAPPLSTATPIATQTPTPKPTSTAWYRDLELPQDQTSLMILGSDQRQDSGFRTDVIMLAIVKPQEASISVVSFPRDLYVLLPGWGYERINTAMRYGGFKMLADTMQYNFGIRPQHYIMTNFQGFIDIIDTLDGIYVEVEQPFSNPCDLTGNGICTVDPGTVRMDGKMALWYVRARQNTGDFDRLRREQEVMLAILKRLVSQDAVMNAPYLYDILKDSVETDMSASDILPYAPLLPKFVRSGHLFRFSIGTQETWPYIAPGGAWVLWPNQAAIQQIIMQAVSVP